MESNDNKNTTKKLSFRKTSPLKMLLAVVVVFAVAGIGTYLLTRSNAATTSAGNSNTCWVKTSDSSLWCWGDNSYGQLGMGSMGGYKSSPVKANIAGVTDVAVGSGFTCATKNDGSLWCWGLNNLGQLGLGNSTDTLNPQKLAIDKVAKISAGESHTCATKTDGTIFCWGLNDYGQLGISSNVNKNVPTQLYFAEVASITAGSRHTCATKNDGTIFCWGLNDYGQLGISSNVNKNVPTQLYFAESAELAAGGSHTCATKNDGSLFCWGLNISGQLGLGDTTNKKVPTRVALNRGYPNGPSNAYARWDFSGSGYYSIEWTNTIAQEPSASLLKENKLHYYAYEFSTTNNYSGYAGFQTNGIFDGTSRGKVVNYSIWNSTGGRCVAPGCLLDAGNTESSGYQLMIPYNYVANHRYRFNLKLGPTGYSGGKTWLGLYVADTSVSGTQLLLGEIAIDGVLSSIFKGSTSAFGEDLHFWDAAYKNYICSDFQSSIAVYSRITANNGSVSPNTFSSSTNTGQTTDLSHNGSTVKVQNCAPNVSTYQDSSKQNVQMNVGYYGGTPPNVLLGY